MADRIKIITVLLDDHDRPIIGQLAIPESELAVVLERIEPLLGEAYQVEILDPDSVESIIYKMQYIDEEPNGEENGSGGNGNSRSS